MQLEQILYEPKETTETQKSYTSKDLSYLSATEFYVSGPISLGPGPLRGGPIGPGGSGPIGPKPLGPAFGASGPIGPRPLEPSPMFKVGPLAPSGPLSPPKLTIRDFPNAGFQLHIHEGPRGTAHLRTYGREKFNINSYDAAMSDLLANDMDVGNILKKYKYF